MALNPSAASCGSDDGLCLRRRFADRKTDPPDGDLIT
jgi:hypothetical protein